MTGIDKLALVGVAACAAVLIALGVTGETKPQASDESAPEPQPEPEPAAAQEAAA